MALIDDLNYLSQLREHPFGIGIGAVQDSLKILGG